MIIRILTTVKLYYGKFCVWFVAHQIEMLDSFRKIEGMIPRAALFFAASALFSSALCAPPLAWAQPAPTPNSAAAPVPITAVGYVVMDLDSGRILEAHNADKRLFPASTTKMMTCLLATEQGKLGDIIRASPAAAATGEAGIGLLSGENQTLSDLLKAAMIRSANDACVDIAEGVGGTQTKFVAMMNARAKELGANNTHFVNPHGLHDPNHFTTARDLALIGQAVSRVDFLNRIAEMKTAEIGGNYKIGPKRLILNRNKLLWRWNACDGLKTGYTKQAGNCLVATATRPDPTTGKPWRLLAVTMKSVPGSSFSDGQHLLERAFKTYRPQQVGADGTTMWKGQIKGGAFPLQAVTVGQARLPLRDQEAASLQEKLELRDLEAPIKKGARVGDAVFWANGKPIVRFPLVAADAVPETLLAKTIPPVGKPVILPNPIRPWGGLLAAGLGALILAFLLVARQRRIARRKRKSARPNGTLERANLPQNQTRRPPPPPTNRQS